MEGKRLIEKIRLRNILSFGDKGGDKGEEITLEPLNIIIGQNASGKSNLVDVIKLLRSLPQDKGLANFISENGGINEWIWKGKQSEGTTEIDVVSNFQTNLPLGELKIETLEYKIRFTEIDRRLLILEETINDLRNNISIKKSDSNNPEQSFLAKTFDKSFTLGTEAKLKMPWLAFVNIILRIRFYTDLQTNRNSEIRKPQVSSLPNEFLQEEAKNLFLVLKDLEAKGNTKEKIINYLRKFNPKVRDYSFEYLAEYIYLFIGEEGLEKPISAMRLSDGTLRYLCLLAILCHPEPPPLICIEEPETGLHPDILPTIAELMKEASQRTQLIVTTHSDILVSAFSDMPEAVLVCEKDEDGTHFKRLEAEKLKEWLNEYSLGDLWLKGEIGGTRW